MDENRSFKMFLGFSAITLAILVIWVIVTILTGGDLGVPQIILLGIVMIAAGSTLKMYNDRKTSQPFEDELSRKRVLYAGYYSYLASVYLWLFIWFLNDYISDTRILFLIGLFGMLIIFGIANVFVRYRVLD